MFEVSLTNEFAPSVVHQCCVWMDGRAGFERHKIEMHSRTREYVCGVCECVWYITRARDNSGRLEDFGECHLPTLANIQQMDDNGRLKKKDQ